MSDIGAVLSAKREELGLSVAAAALRSNLSIDLIEKLESNRFTEIGAPVFTRGYLVMYAKSLNLDDTVLGERFNSLKEEYELSISPANVASQSKSFKRNYLKTWLFLIPVILISFVLLEQLLDSRSWLMTQINHAFTPVSVENSADGSGEVSPNIVLEVGGNSVRLSDDLQSSSETATEPSAGDKDNNAVVLTLPANEKPANNITDNATVAATQQPETEASLPETDTSDDNPSLVATDNSSEQTTVKKGIALHINRESWMQINNAKGKIVLSRTLKAGENIDLPANEGPYKLNIGRPENVVLTINGQEQPLDKYSLPGSIRKFKVEIPSG